MSRHILSLFPYIASCMKSPASRSSFVTASVNQMICSTKKQPLPKGRSCMLIFAPENRPRVPAPENRP